MTTLIGTDHPLPEPHRRTLRHLAACMIPADERYAVPGADDDAIFTDLLATARPHASSIAQALAALDAIAGEPFSDLGDDARAAAAERFRASGSPLVGLLVSLVVQCYYRDDRVMRSLGMEPRPPFPAGYEVEDGDWSLLNPVRARGRMYREAP